MKLSNKKLAVFFTTGISLGTWAKVGNLSREVEIYNRLARHFQKIYFVTYGDSQEELKFRGMLDANIEILPKTMRFIPNRLYAFLLPLLYREVFRNVDVLKTNQMTGALSAVLTKLMYKKKLVVRCGYELLKNELIKKTPKYKVTFVFLLEWFVYKNADFIIASTNLIKEFIDNTFNRLRREVRVIPNYIDVAKFRPDKTVYKEKGRVCYVGRLEKMPKNILNLIEAISVLPLRLILIGDGSQRGAIEKLVKENNIDNIELLGSLSNNDLPRELNKSEIFILPSFFEGNPKALLEAMSCALPCIGTNVDGICDLIDHNANGYICETSVPALRNALVTVAGDEGLREKLAQNARQTILDKYSVDEILKRELDVYSIL